MLLFLDANNMSLVTDAVNPELRYEVMHTVNLSISEVRYIEQNLEDYEKVRDLFHV